MSAPYLPVPDLIRRIEDRDCFPSVVSNDEILTLINAAERLVGRARQEMLNRWTESLRAPDRAPR
jgi:hypothetical protein